MFSSRISFRAVIVSWILGAILFLVPLASVLAGGGGTNFPK
jgi:hypothetical protein